jgi:hypothetical protein
VDFNTLLNNVSTVQPTFTISIPIQLNKRNKTKPSKYSTTLFYGSHQEIIKQKYPNNNFPTVCPIFISNIPINSGRQAEIKYNHKKVSNSTLRELIGNFPEKYTQQ